MIVPKLRDLPRAKIDEAYRATHGLEKEIQSINRGCKAGILKTVLEGATVHFNLDHFMEATNTQDAPDKKDKKDQCREGFYTVKELRFIKRLCDSFPSLTDKIKFYQKGQEVAAPWNQPELRAGWEKYKRKAKGDLEGVVWKN